MEGKTAFITSTSGAEVCRCETNERALLRGLQVEGSPQESQVSAQARRGSSIAYGEGWDSEG